MAKSNYPNDLLYNPDHDWARIDPAHPEEATFGITWYAQDSLGEVVSFEAPKQEALLDSAAYEATLS